MANSHFYGLLDRIQLVQLQWMIVLWYMQTLFIQTKMTHKENGERVIMKITGELVDILLKMDPEKFKGYLVYEKLLKVIYMVILGEIYGMLFASFLW